MGQGQVIVGGYPRVVVGTGQGHWSCRGHVRITGSQTYRSGSWKVKEQKFKIWTHDPLKQRCMF